MAHFAVSNEVNNDVTTKLLAVLSSNAESVGNIVH